MSDLGFSILSSKFSLFCDLVSSPLVLKEVTLDGGIDKSDTSDTTCISIYGVNLGGSIDKCNKNDKSNILIYQVKEGGGIDNILKCKFCCFCQFCHVSLYPHPPLPDLSKCRIQHFCCIYVCIILPPYFAKYIEMSVLSLLLLLLHMSLPPPNFTPYIEISVLSHLSIHPHFFISYIKMSHLSFLLLLSYLSTHTHTYSYISLLLSRMSCLPCLCNTHSDIHLYIYSYSLLDMRVVYLT